MKHVYAMQRADGAVKVGISTNPDSRKKTVAVEVRQSVNVSFAIPPRSDARAVEIAAHKLLRDKHETGEWFFVSVEEAMAAISLAVDIVEGRAPDITSIIPRIPNVNKYREIDGDVMMARNFRLPKPLLKELEDLSEKQGVKQPELVRRALREFLDKYKTLEMPR